MLQALMLAGRSFISLLDGTAVLVQWSLPRYQRFLLEFPGCEIASEKDTVRQSSICFFKLFALRGLPSTMNASTVATNPFFQSYSRDARKQQCSVSGRQNMNGI